MQFEAVLRGTSFRPIEAKAIVNQLNDGDILALMREPENRFDANAIMVLAPDTNDHLGYVAKEVAVELAPLMDEGRVFTCKVNGRMSASVVTLLIEDDIGPVNADNID